MLGGGRVMLEEGLLERFPMGQLYGLHNWPKLPVGSFAVRPGPMMAAADRFTLTLRGQGGHGAMPELARDPVVAAAQIVLAMQTIVSRNVDPVKQAVVSVTQVHSGDAFNVIPQTATIAGTCRSFAPEVRDLIERRITSIGHGVGEALQVEVDVVYERGYPPTVNSEAETVLAAQAAADVVGDARVDRATPPVMGAEDFSYMLEQRPGSYIFMGSGRAEAPLHSPQYDFNDEALTVGASYWARLVERLLRLVERLLPAG
jgi:amidohydrolase